MSGEAQGRYSGHERLCEFDIVGQRRIREGCVAVIGCGGLGSVCIELLAAAGVGRLRLVDGDRVELSNLQRQTIHTTDDIGRLKAESAARRVRALNGDVEVEAVCEYLDATNARRILGGVDVVADCTDSYGAKRLIAGLCVAMGLRLVTGAVSRFRGMAMSYRPSATCYGCVFGEETDGASETSCAAAGIFNGVVALTGAVEGCEVLKLLTGAGDALTDRLLTIDALTMEMQTVKLRRDPACALCGGDRQERHP